MCNIKFSRCILVFGVYLFLSPFVIRCFMESGMVCNQGNAAVHNSSLIRDVAPHTGIFTLYFLRVVPLFLSLYCLPLIIYIINSYEF